jgi:hypothetical protein
VQLRDVEIPEKTFAVVRDNKILAALTTRSGNLLAMNKKYRDLLVLMKKNTLHASVINNEVEWLHSLLYETERLDNIALAHELIDLRRYKIYNNSFHVKNVLRGKEEPAFVFLFNKN